MNKKKSVIVGLIIVFFFIVYLIIDFFCVSPVYLYITDYKDSNIITLNVTDGQGHYKFKKYKLTEIESGVYQIQGYGSLLSGKNYPLEIHINNKNGHIKKIIQKNLDGKLETILDSQRLTTEKN